jgi:ketosteroid isomerase-like protein
MAEISPETVVNDFLDAWGSGRVDAVMTLFSDDTVFVASQGPEPGQTYRGRSEIFPAVERMLATSAESRFRVTEVLPIEDGAVATWVIEGLPADAPGAKGIDVFKVRDGRVTSKDAYRKLMAR